jgi:hypothetical protein
MLKTGSTMVRMMAALALTSGILAPALAEAAQVRSSDRPGKATRTVEERCRREVDEQHPAGTRSTRRNERAILIQTCIDRARRP